MRKIYVAPSLLAADKENLGKEVIRASKLGSDFIHLDIMDNQFVPNKSFTFDEIKSVSSLTNLVNDVHLMVFHPENVFEDYASINADYITFHYEAVEEKDIIPFSKKIHSLKVKAGISIKPKTSPETIFKYLPYFDLVLVMSVEPGFGGQKFMPNSLEKIRALREYIDKNNLPTLIEVDGGVNGDNYSLLKDAGVDILVAGTYLFKSSEMEQRIKDMKK